MPKVLHPAYFPVTACDAYPAAWENFTLEQAMAAYWKVKSWSFSLSNYSGGGGGSFNVFVDVDKISDLVCPTFSTGFGFGGDEVFGMSGSVSPFGISMSVEFFDDLSFDYSSAGNPPGGFNQPVTIIIGDQTITTNGENNNDSMSATITITATDFFDIEN